MTDLSMFTKELQPLENEVISLKQKAEALVITTDEQYAEAGDIAKVVKDKSSAIEKMRKFFTVPINKQLDDINGLFMPKTKEADEIVTIIKRKMATYHQNKEDARIKEEARLQSIRDKANEKREEKGQEAIAEPIKTVAEVPRTVSTGVTQSTVKKVWTHEIISINELPEDVKKAIFAEAFNKGIIKTVVQKFVNAGVRDMTGVRIYQDSQISLR